METIIMSLLNSGYERLGWLNAGIKLPATVWERVWRSDTGNTEINKCDKLKVFYLVDMS